MKWCPLCEKEASPHWTCMKHADVHKEVDSITLHELDRDVVLSLIDQEQDIPWRLALKLYEALRDAEAGEDVTRDDRDRAEKTEAAWRRALERALGETIGDRTPDEVIAMLIAKRGGP